MAEGLLRDQAGDRFEVFSAGVEPSRVRPEAITVMKEIGIDLVGQRSKHLNEFAGQSFDFVVTVCDNVREICPVFPGPTERIHRAFADPGAFEGSEEQRLRMFRNVRDQIREFLSKFPQRD